MLKNKPAISTLPVEDIDRAKHFYAHTLDLGDPTMEMPGNALFDAGRGTQILLYQRSHTKADNTAVTFIVDDIEEEVTNLKNKGVIFEEYDMPEMKTINSIATDNNIKAAWFKDTEGNILGITQM